MMTSYTAFARFCDAAQGERAEHAAYLRELIDRYHPSARTVLELDPARGRRERGQDPRLVKHLDDPVVRTERK
jgi:hypothetical protein